MLTRDFEQLLIVFFFLIATVVFAYGMYCNRKSRSFAGTGRVADIEAWHIKAVLSWIATFGLSLVAVVNFF